MKRQVFLVWSLLCLVLVSGGVVASAHAAALVVTSVSGPQEAFLNQTISVICWVKNKGDEASGAYEVALYLSRDRTVNPSSDRFLKKVVFASGLDPGQSKKATVKVAVPNSFLDGLSGEYYFGAVVGSIKKASLNKVAVLRYEDNGDGTVSDMKTGLMWQKSDDGTQRTWLQAQTYCEDLELAGYDDWVLPPVDVLVAIVDYARWYPACDPTLDCRSSFYWSGSTYANYPGYAWTVHFDYGYAGWGDKIVNVYVRCARGGP